MSNFSDANVKHESRSGLPLRMRQSCLPILVLFAFALGGAFVQEAVEGVDSGNYHYQGSFELGYRFVNTKWQSHDLRHLRQPAARPAPARADFEPALAQPPGRSV